MKKIKKRFIKGVIIVCVLSLFSSAILRHEPTKKVNADTYSWSDTFNENLAYFDVELLGTNQIRFTLYLLDAYELLQPNFVSVYYYDENFNLTSDEYEFLRYSLYDKDDYDAYIFNKIFSESDMKRIKTIILYADEFSLTEDPFNVAYDFISIPNPYIKYESYLNGQSDGFTSGYQDGLEDGYGNGLEVGYRDGITEGYAEGFNAGESSQIDVNFMQSIFTSLDAFFQIHFAPNLTIGELFLAPLIIWFVWFIIKQFKGGD